MAKAKKGPTSQPGRFAYEGLDRVIHEKARLGILTCLMTRAEGLSFTEIKELCDLTDGNLNRHLDVLAEAGLVKVRKDQGEGRSRTHCQLTSLGRTRFLKYLQELERVVSDAAQASEARGSSLGPDFSAT
jgi:DNA-binding MarR family transcriptional regulator